MAFKPRTKSSELVTLESLNKRMSLPPKDKQYYISLKKGFEGEKKFDLWREKLSSECLILNDLLLQINNTIFQIDSLVITALRIFIYEVKNFEGDYIYDPQSNKFFIMPNQEIVNPLLQMERCESLLNQLLSKHGMNFPLEGEVVFINDAFTLYQAPPNQPIIFLSQLKKYFTKMNGISAPLSSQHFALAEKLASLHITDPEYKKIPPYSYDKLRKGITCRKCNSFSITIKRVNSICESCGFTEKIPEAVMRTVREFQVLFPEEKITARIIQDWCQAVKSKRVIANILAQNFRQVGENRWSHYE